MRISYTRDFLLSLSQLDICKKLPTGFESFDQSILSEFDDAFYNVQDRQRISGSLSLQSFRHNEYGSSPPTRGDSSNYSQGILGRWENRSSRRSEKDSGSQSGWDSGAGNISSQKSNHKANSKASYAMIPNKNEKLKAPQNQTTSNIFQVLGTVPKAAQTYAQTASSSQASTQYVTKAHLMKVQILEPHHFSKSGSPDISKFFSKGKFFIQNNLEKTRKFYEFILVDTDSVEISHIQNKDSTDICYSKCRICKIISLTQWGQSLDTHKMFSQNFKPKSYDYQDYMDAWFYTFLFRPCDHSWFFDWNDKIQNDFPNWFQEWWLFFGAIQDIFCPQILSVYNYFNEHARNLIPTPCCHILFFMSRFSIPWILSWDFVQTQLIPKPFPAHLAREFKVKWWSNFSPSATQQLPHIKNWIATTSLTKIQTPFQMPYIILDSFLLSQKSFPSNKEFKKHLKMLLQKASEILSQLASSDSDEDTASSNYLGDQNEDLYYGLPYTPLE